jgi:PhoPQ-activated pathogenicity-related protein
MALTLIAPTVTFDRDNNTITITDETGLYNVNTNPGGWGTPNTALTDISVYTGVEFKLTMVVYTTSNTTGTEYEIDYTTFYNEDIPESVDDLEFTELIASDFGLTSFTDGLYEFKLSVSHDLVGATGDENTSPSVYFLIVDDLQTSLNQAFVSIPRTYNYEGAHLYTSDYKQILDLLFSKSLFKVLDNIQDDHSYISLHFTDVLNMLATIETIIQKYS